MSGKSVPFFVYYADDYATYQIDYGCPIENGVASPTRKFQIIDVKLLRQFNYILFSYNLDSIKIL